MKRLIILAGFALVGCNTPYPNQGDLFLSPNASVSANKAAKGTDSYCENYARQTQDNFYDANRDSDSANGFIYVQAKGKGREAYDRCRRGRTGWLSQTEIIDLSAR